jgi:p-aminobenzoyl-glutamate transporter AbgT
MRILVLMASATLTWLMTPEFATACDRCFGAGSDAPAVRAVTASMMGLFIVMSFVFGGVFSFFNGANNRAMEIERAREIEAARTHDSVLPPSDSN